MLTTSRRLAASMLATSLLLPSCALFGGKTPGPPDAKRLFAQSKPATVLVLSTFAAHVSVPASTVDQTKLELKLLELVASGQVGTSEQELIIAALNLIFAEPLSYLIVDPNAPKREKDTEIQATGSGFIASPDGYVVTNAHVVAPLDDDLKTELANIALQDFINEDVAELQTDLPGVPQEFIDKLADADAIWLARNLTVESLNKEFALVVGATGAGSTTTLEGIPAELAEAGEPIPGKDVAVLKIETKNLPTIPIGDDTAISTGDDLYVIGYPGAATFHPVLSLESIAEPSFTQGSVSAKKKATAGFEVIQTDAAVTHGNSGGPVIDTAGNVIGIATFGSIDPTTNETAQGFNFIMPSTLIRQFLDRAGAKPAIGTFSQLYNEALDAEEVAYHKRALETFQRINTIAPGHPYVQERISANQSAIEAGKDETPAAWLPFAAGGGGLTLVAALVILFIVLRGRRKPAPVLEAAGMAAPGAPPGFTPPEQASTMPPGTGFQTPATTPAPGMTPAPVTPAPPMTPSMATPTPSMAPTPAATPTAAQVLDLVGSSWAGYRIVSKLGQGGMAVVYKAHQENLDRYVALKLLLPQHHDSSLLERFSREAKMVAGLRHPNIVTVHDFGEEQGIPYLVMAYIDGETLLNRMKSPVSAAKAVGITAQMARALDHAHQQGIVHRDVKPSNVLLAREDWSLLSDFGIAKALESPGALTQTGTGIGTPEYMSPEQCEGKEIDGRSDIYSLGIVLYQMLAGRPPFMGETPVSVIVKHLSEAPPPPRDFNAEIPAPIEAVALKAMAKKAEDRYATAEEMALALEAAAGA